MAVAVLGWPSGGDDAARRAAHLDLALLAYKLGYFVLDILEVSDAGSAGYDWAEALAARTDADAFIVAGPVDHARLEGIASDRRMVVRAAVALAG